VCNRIFSYTLIHGHIQIYGLAKGQKNPADGPSRRPDYAIGYENMTAKFLATLAVTTIAESYGDLPIDIKAAQETNIFAPEIRPTLVNISTGDEGQWRSIDGAVT
jgi:hypothetical protein